MGQWSPIDGELCNGHHLCDGDNRTWVTEAPLIIFNATSACQLLADNNINQVYTFGCSYMRHIYCALMIILTDDYVHGCLKETLEDNILDLCSNEQQFSEKQCNTGYLKSNESGLLVCDGKVKFMRKPRASDKAQSLDPPLGTFFDDEGSKGKLLLYSIGNYAVAPTLSREIANEMKITLKSSEINRFGVNDATAKQLEMNKTGHCPLDQRGYERVVWFSTHSRVRAHHPDESREKIKTYNEGMRQFIESKSCGDISYIDTFNFTEQLIRAPPSHNSMSSLTFDGVHWGLEVNLIKGQMLFNALARIAVAEQAEVAEQGRNGQN